MFLLVLVSVALFNCLLAAPSSDGLPPVNVSTGTLMEQHEAIKQCWQDALIGHGPGSADPWAEGTDKGARVTKPGDCDLITTWYENCKCFKSVIQSNGQTGILIYYVHTGATEREYKAFATLS